MNKQNNQYKIIDGTLEKVHQIQESLWKKRQGLNWEEKIKQMNKEVDKYTRDRTDSAHNRGDRSTGLSS